MSYQPLDWDSSKLLELKNNKINLVKLFESLDLNETERFTFDRAVSICNFLLQEGLFEPTVLDLGSSGGVFSLTLNYMLSAHATAVDDDRYILVQGESNDSSIKTMKDRLSSNNINGIIPVNSSIEDYINNLPPFPIYDVVLLLNILHHFYTGYGQCSDHGYMSWEETIALIQKIGNITRKYLFFEINSLVINEYENYITDILYAGGFRELKYVSRSIATDGKIRALWCFVK
jgi:hypothetical protein